MIRPFESGDSLCRISTNPISDRDFIITIYQDIDSLTIIDNGVVSFFDIIGDSLLLKWVEMPSLKATFSSPVLVGDSTSYDGVLLYGDRMSYSFEGRATNQAGMSTIIADDMTVNRLIKRRSVMLFNSFSDKNAGAMHLPDIIYDKEEWYTSEDNLLPIVRQITTSYIAGADTISSETISMANINRLEETYKRQLVENFPDNAIYEDGLSFSDIIKMTVNLVGVNDLEIQGCSTDGNDHEVTVDVFNTLGQRMAPSLTLTITPEESARTISLLTSQSGAYFVHFNAGNIFETIKVTQ